jgi:hypothetical protein
MKIVINRCFGGYGLSHEAIMRYLDLRGITVYPEQSEGGGTWKFLTYWLVKPEDRLEEKEGESFYTMTMDERQDYNKRFSDETFGVEDISRDDPVLIEVIEELGDAANGDCAELAIVEIPDDVEWEISEYDGSEHVAEKHRVWY